MSQSTIKGIRKRGSIKYENDYHSKAGRPRRVSKYQKGKIKGYVREHNRKTLKSVNQALNLKVSKQTLSGIFREIGIPHRKMKVQPVLKASHEERREVFDLNHCNPTFDCTKEMRQCQVLWHFRRGIDSILQ
jgi:transposase